MNRLGLMPDTSDFLSSDISFDRRREREHETGDGGLREGNCGSSRFVRDTIEKPIYVKQTKQHASNAEPKYWIQTEQTGQNIMYWELDHHPYTQRNL